MVESYDAYIPSGARLLAEVEPVPLPALGISQTTCARLGYGKADLEGRPVQVATYYSATGTPVAQWVPTPDGKVITFGSMSRACLFGQRAVKGGGPMVVVTENPREALAVDEALKGRWPVVAGKGPLETLTRDLADQSLFFEGFPKIVLCLGEGSGDVAREITEMFHPGKVHVATLPAGFSKPTDMTRGGQTAALVDRVFRASPWRPDGVFDLNDLDLVERIVAPMKPGIPYPWPVLTDKTNGIVPRQLHMHCGGPGCGKSTALAQIAYHLRKVHGVSIGYISLEEGIVPIGRRLAGLELKVPLYIPGDYGVTDDDMRKALARVAGEGQVVLYDAWGSQNAERLAGVVRYLAISRGCKVIFLDHISIVVSGDDQINDERRSIDLLMTRLRGMAEALGISILIISHLKRPYQGKGWDEGRQISMTDLRGSGSLEQLSDVIIGYERDQQSETARDIMTVRVLKARLGGDTGVADTLRYDRKTGYLNATKVNAVPKRAKNSQQDNSDY